MFSYLVVLTSLLVRHLDATWTTDEWTTSDQTESLCSQWKSKMPPILALGEAHNGSFFIVDPTLHGLLVRGAEQLQVNTKTASLSLFAAEKVHLVPPGNASGDHLHWIKRRFAFIALTDTQSLLSIVKMPPKDDDPAELYSFPLNGKPMWTGTATAFQDDLKFDDKVLISGPKAGQFILLDSEGHLVVGTFNKKTFEDFTKLPQKHLPLLQMTNTSLGTIETTAGSVDGGFLYDRTLILVNNTAQEVLLYNLDSPHPVEAYAQVPFADFIVCGCCGNNHILYIGIGIGIVLLIILVLGTLIAVKLSARNNDNSGGKTTKKSAATSNQVGAPSNVTSDGGDSKQHSGSSRALFSSGA